jgi:hypothetical protein
MIDRKTVFILGAGFSKGFNPDNVPLVNEILDIAEKNCILRPNGEHKELIRFINKYFGDYHQVNIETLASFLLTELIPDVFQKKEPRNIMYEQLFEIITKTLSWVHQKPKDKVIDEIYSNFANKLVKNNVNVISFNYDLILDKYLLKTHKWSIASGYGVKMRISGVPEEKQEIYNPNDISTQYLKLHGSLNWGKCIVPHAYRGEEILVSPFGENQTPIIPIESTVGSSSSFSSPDITVYFDTFIIPPILQKEQLYRTTLLQNIWYAAKHIISNTNEIYIIGYSFPPTDFITEFLFRQSIAKNISNRKVKIVNISIDDDYKRRVENIFQKCDFEYIPKDVVKFLEDYNNS